MKKLSLFITLFMIIVLSIGCSSESTKTDSTTANNTVNTEQSNGTAESATTENQDKIEVVTSKDIPEGWREDLLPIIDGAQIFEASSGELPTGSMWDIEAYSDKSFDEVYSFYKDVMKDAENFVDYTLEAGAVGGPEGTKNLLGKKGEYQIAMLILPPDAGKVKISMSLFVAANK